MSNKDIIKQKNEEIDKAARDFETLRLELEAQLDAARRLRDETINAAQAERDAAALAEKLKGYPPDVIAQTNCSVCGEVMRPFSFTENGQIVKSWACSMGSLQPHHDLIRV